MQHSVRLLIEELTPLTICVGAQQYIHEYLRRKRGCARCCVFHQLHSGRNGLPPSNADTDCEFESWYTVESTVIEGYAVLPLRAAVHHCSYARSSGSRNAYTMYITQLTGRHSDRTGAKYIHPQWPDYFVY